jgi:hypothetical protein
MTRERLEFGIGAGRPTADETAVSRTYAGRGSHVPRAGVLYRLIFVLLAAATLAVWLSIAQQVGSQ